MTVRELQFFLDRIEDKDAEIIVWLDQEDTDGYAALENGQFTISSDGSTEVVLNTAS